VAKYNGFASYLTTGTFTKEFIADYEYWCKRIFWQWKGLQMEFDTFYETCWEALLTKIDEFDPKVATIQTFCISRINNEAWRRYMKIKNGKDNETDVDSDVLKNTLESNENIEEKERPFDDFIRYCNTMGIMVNKKELIREYYSYNENDSKTSPVMLAYAWWRATNNEVGGRDDIFSKRKRQSLSKSSN
jgi:hypothetical protein